MSHSAMIWLMSYLASTVKIWLLSRMAHRAPQDQDKYVVRFPDGMRERLKEAARENGKTLNFEIVSRLEQSFAPSVKVPPELLGRIAKVAARRETTPEDLVIGTLTQAFPAPFNVENAVFEIRNLVKVLKAGAKDSSLSLLLDDLYSLATDIAEGRIEVREAATAEEIGERLRRYEAHGGALGWEHIPVDEDDAE